MQRHRSEWDVTTEKGRKELERFLMERMGFERDGRHYWRWGGIALPEGWIFTGDGMVWAKEWALEYKDIVISSQLGCMEHYDAIAEVTWWPEDFDKRPRAEAQDEPTAVALALARALEEMEAQGGGDGA